MNEFYILHVSILFYATRALRDYEGPCAEVHGHHFRVQADVVTPAPGETGMVIDFYHIKTRLENIVMPWEQGFLNEITPFETLNPTNENLAKYCFDALSAALRHPLARVQSIAVWETPEVGVTYSSSVYK
jgi:6-pyruvoyltetrahydropterin/6-carboxytetrahydropterin synthase